MVCRNVDGVHGVWQISCLISWTMLFYTKMGFAIGYSFWILVTGIVLVKRDVLIQLESQNLKSPPTIGKSINTREGKILNTSIKNQYTGAVYIMISEKSGSHLSTH